MAGQRHAATRNAVPANGPPIPSVAVSAVAESACFMASWNLPSATNPSAAWYFAEGGLYSGHAQHEVAQVAILWTHRRVQICAVLGPHRGSPGARSLCSVRLEVEAEGEAAQRLLGPRANQGACPAGVSTFQPLWTPVKQPVAWDAKAVWTLLCQGFADRNLRVQKSDHDRTAPDSRPQ